MIDFRYHLVSIVSIFFALAVGIVLGAGPLQSNIGTTLGEQVVQLRTEKQELRDSLDETERTVTAGQEYAEAVTGRVVDGRLADRSAVVLSMPDADTDLVEAMTGVVAQSGAEVTGSVDLTEDWFDPELADERAGVAEEAATALGLASTSTGDVLLREVLGKVLVSPDAEEPSASRAAALEVLVDADLVETSTAELAPASLVVLVSGTYAGSESDVAAQSDEVRALALVLEVASDTTVVVGDAPVIAAGQPATSDAVAAVREGEESSAAVSTVDHAKDGMGPSVVVLAIESQLAGRVGHYGVSEGATSLVPQVVP